MRNDDSTGYGPNAFDSFPLSPHNLPAMPVQSETVPLGEPAPDFALTAIDGSEARLSGLRGKPVVLVFLRGFG